MKNHSHWSIGETPRHDPKIAKRQIFIQAMLGQFVAHCKCLLRESNSHLRISEAKAQSYFYETYVLTVKLSGLKADLMQTNDTMMNIFNFLFARNLPLRRSNRRRIHLASSHGCVHCNGVWVEIRSVDAVNS